MHPELIKARIRMGGTTPSNIARELGVSRMTVSQVIHGRGVSKKVARRISEITKEPVGALWPGKYPDLEFIESAGLAHLSGVQAEADLEKLQRPAATPAARPSTKAAIEKPAKPRVRKDR